MPKLNPISWRKFDKFVIAQGCILERISGDHRIYWKKGLKRPVVFPQDDPVPVFIIRNNLRILGMSTKEYSDTIYKF